MNCHSHQSFKFALCGLLLSFTFGCGSAATEVEESAPATFYPQAPDPPRIQFLRSISKGTDIEPGRSGLDTLLFGEQEIEKSVMAPYGAAVHDGKIYICDVQQGVILTLDILGQEMGFLEFAGRGALQKPVNLAFAPDGRLFVADLGRRQIVVFGKDMQYQRELGPFGEKSKIVDVEVQDDKLYSLDTGNSEIRVFDLNSSKELMLFGSKEIEGDGPSHKAPTNITVGEDGTCYVVDSILCQVFVWTPEGKFDRFIGQPGDTVGEFARPKGIGLDQDKLYVVDAAFENCQILDMEGEPLMAFGNPGILPSNMDLPAGLWIGEEGLEMFKNEIDPDFKAERLIIVTNLFGEYKVNFYALGKSSNFTYD